MLYVSFKILQKNNHSKRDDKKVLNGIIFYIVFQCTVKILKFGTPQTIAIIVLKIEKFDVTLH